MNVSKATKGIYLRGKTYWIRYAGLDGKIVYESSGSQEFKEAETLLGKRRWEIGSGKQPEVKRIANHSFNELAEQYMTWIEGRHASAKVKGYVIGLLKTRFGNIPLRRFSTLLVDDLQTDLIKKGHKNAYINKVLNIFKAMLSKAVEWEMVEAETLKRVRKVKNLREDKRLRYLSVDECQRLIEHCKPHLKPIVMIALNTGMRKGEILHLKWDNVDLVHGFILLDKTKNGERREIPMNGTVKAVFQGLPRRLDGGYLFYDIHTGKNYDEVKRSFASACRGAKLLDLHFHDLRHTFASHLVMAGVDLTSVKELLGHKTLAMTLRYSHLAPSHKVKAVEILDSTLNKTPTIQESIQLRVTG